MNVVVMVMLMILANLLFMAVISDTTQSISTQTMINAKTQTIREETELEPILKSELMLLMAQHGLNSMDLEKGLTKKLRTEPPQTSLHSTISADHAADYLIRWREVSVGQNKVHVRVVNSSEPLDPVGYIEYETCRDPDPRDPAVARRQRLRMRTALKGGFSNAITGQSLTCVLCHSHVYGNVGEYGNHLKDQLHRSKIYGNWFTAGILGAMVTDASPPYPMFTTRSHSQMISSPDTQPTVINPDDVAHVQPPGLPGTAYAFSAQGSYDGPELPWNPQSKKRSLPKFDPRSMRILAKGTITGGSLILVPYGSSYPGVPTTVNKVVEGNLIVDGRTSPVRIQGRVYVTGDVIIMGRYQGQGAIYSGRNIYVADDLTATNRSPVFNKSAASNLTMSSVSIPSQGLNISDSIWNSDRLMLVATNNVVIGNPFPFQLPTPGSPTTPRFKTIDSGREVVIDPEIGSEIRYITKVALRNFENELYYERKTGYMASATNMNGRLCLTLPWEDTTRQCVEINPATNEFKSNERFVKTSAEYRPLADPLDDYKSWTAHYVPEGYWKNFLPLNVTDRNTGQLGFWMDDVRWKSLVRTSASALADINHARQRDVCERHPRSLFQEIPYDNLPLSQGQLSKTWIKNRLEQTTKIYTRLRDFRVKFREVENFGFGTDEDYNGEELLDRYIEMCLENIARGTSPGPSSFHLKQTAAESLPGLLPPSAWQPNMNRCNAQISGASGNPTYTYNDAGTTRTEPAITHWSQRFDSQNFPSMPNPNIPVLTCQFDFFADDASCSPGGGQKYGAFNITMHDYPGSHYLGTPLKYMCGGGTYPTSYGRPVSCQRTLVKVPFQQCTACVESLHNPDGTTTNVSHAASECHASCACAPTSNAFYFWRNADWLIPQSRISTMPDFRLTIQPDINNRPDIRVLSRFWDPAYDDMIDVEIREIDAFLFANQFVSHATNSIHDRQVQINGGVSAKELAGRFAGRVGFDRPYAEANHPAPGYRRVPGLMESDEIGLVVTQDPRFQYLEDLIQEDFGTLELRQSITGGAATCP